MSLVTLLSLALTILTLKLGQAQDLPGPWTSFGCYTDDQTQRTLTAIQTGNLPGGTTVESCVDYCSDQGYSWAGVEYSTECYCGVFRSIQSTQTPNEDCDMPCQGDDTETCGGPNKIQLYTNGEPQPTNPGVPHWNYIGCWKDSPDQGFRTFPVVPQVDEPVTPLTCGQACNGYFLFGTEYGGECYCGFSLDIDFRLPESACSMSCNANREFECGGPGALSAHQATFS